MKSSIRVAAFLTVIAIAAAACGAFISTTFAPRWQATVLVGIGQMGIGRDRRLTDPGALVQRVNFKGFAQQALKAAGLPPDSSVDMSALPMSTLKATVARGGDHFVELSVEARSRDQAMKVAEAALGILQAEHAQILQPGKARLEKSLADTNKSIDSLTRERTLILERIQSNGDSAAKKFSENVMLSEAIRSSDTELRVLREMQRSLEEQLDPSRTFNTRAVAPIYAPERPIKPKKLVGALIGLCFGLLLDFALLISINTGFRRQFNAFTGLVPAAR